MTRSFGDMPWELSDCRCTVAARMMELWQPMLSLRHFKRPIGLAIAEPEVQVISLSDKELHGVAFFRVSVPIGRYRCIWTMYEQTSQGQCRLETGNQRVWVHAVIDRGMQDCRVWFTTRTDFQILQKCRRFRR